MLSTIGVRLSQFSKHTGSSATLLRRDKRTRKQSLKSLLTSNTQTNNSVGSTWAREAQKNSWQPLCEPIRKQVKLQEEGLHKLNDSRQPHLDDWEPSPTGWTWWSRHSRIRNNFQMKYNILVCWTTGNLTNYTFIIMIIFRCFPTQTLTPPCFSLYGFKQNITEPVQ